MAKNALPPPEPDPPLVWRYTGFVERMYASVPVTVAPGAVLEWPTVPAQDGYWEPAEPGAEPTVHPDNTAAAGAPRAWQPDELTWREGTPPALREYWDTPTMAAGEPAPVEQEVSGDA